MTVPTDYVLALGLTILVEAFVVLAPRDRRGGGVLLDVVLANLLTHPLAWQLLASGRSGFLATEAGVVAVETLCYAVLGRRSVQQAFGIACAANLVTALLGLLWSLAAP